MAPKAQQQFREGDVVWALDTGRYYKARVLAAEKAGSTWSYFIHFLQWNRKWDRWFEADGLKSIDDAEVEAAAAEARKSNMGIATEVSAEEAAAAQSLKEEEQNRKRRRKTLATQELCEEDAATYSKLPVPFTLKKLLVDEWETVTKAPNRLPQLPREMCVRHILYDFLESKRRRADDRQIAKYQDLLEGLCLYFDKALPMILLYRQERAQYDAVLHEWPDAAPSTIYGVEHLLRLFVKIPRLMADVVLPATELNHVQSKFTELLKFLQKNHSTYFVGEYVPEEDAINRDVDVSARAAALEERRKGLVQSQDANDDEQEAEEEKEEASAAEAKEAEDVGQQKGRGAKSARDSEGGQSSRNSKKRRSRG